MLPYIKTLVHLGQYCLFKAVDLQATVFHITLLKNTSLEIAGLECGTICTSSLYSTTKLWSKDQGSLLQQTSVKESVANFLPEFPLTLKRRAEPV